MSYIEFVYPKTLLNVEKYKNRIYASINPYIGCAHQCRYCYVQAEKYSKDNIYNIKIKQNVLEFLAKQLSKYLTSYEQGIIYLGSSCDPYQPVEDKFGLSQKILKFILQHTYYNIHIFTKSKLVLRDIEIFKEFKERINISITLITSENNLKEIFEQNASSIEDRIMCIKVLNSQGINCGASIMPILPYITDTDTQLNNLFYLLKLNNCRYIWWDYLTLRKNITNINRLSQRDIYYDTLRKYFPELIPKYDKLYENRIIPHKLYRVLIDKKIIKLAKKYSLSTTGPIWKYTKFSYLFNY